MAEIDVPQLIDWLGPEGAVAGLEKSKLTNSDLMILARKNGHEVDKKTGRRQLSIELIMSSIRRIDKSTDSLLGMSIDEIQRYFTERMVSNKEIISLLDELGIPPSGKIRGKLSDYAAREIRELGMFQRVAKGSKPKTT